MIFMANDIHGTLCYLCVVSCWIEYSGDMICGT